MPLGRIHLIRWIGALSLVAAAFALPACSSDSSTSSSTATTAEAPAAHDGGEADWSYSGATGPANWSKLSPEYTECKTGKEQSPIAIKPLAANPNLKPPTVSYATVKSEVFNNGHTVEAAPLETGSNDSSSAGGFVTLAGREYALKQVHFHAHSEHTISGKDFALELHFVNQDADGNAVVLGLLVQPGATNPDWQAFVDAMIKASPSKPAETQLPWSKMAPNSYQAYTYNGSLTTPPCSQVVEWFVVSKPITMSADQIASFTGDYDHNYRPIQPLNGRSVRLTGSN